MAEDEEEFEPEPEAPPAPDPAQVPAPVAPTPLAAPGADAERFRRLLLILRQALFFAAAVEEAQEAYAGLCLWPWIDHEVGQSAEAKNVIRQKAEVPKPPKKHPGWVEPWVRYRASPPVPGNCLVRPPGAEPVIVWAKDAPPPAVPKKFLKLLKRRDEWQPFVYPPDIVPVPPPAAAKPLSGTARKKKRK